ncbi:LLM class flavin-dependent oxidoreductase [Nonomuraea salmonea]|uniref:LLM class flavin-dependent oxidoreductase n=1 Tax=Nonomuraea salmonea TaxID=46181 RepID=UPI002FE80006
MSGNDRLDLGPFGIYTFDFEHLPAARVRDAVQELEELGWPAVWVPELLGREALSHAGFLLASTERLKVVNGIAQIWSRGARWAHGGALLLADAYPGRHVLGLGFGGEPKPGVKPLGGDGGVPGRDGRARDREPGAAGSGAADPGRVRAEDAGAGPRPGRGRPDLPRERRAHRAVARAART